MRTQCLRYRCAPDSLRSQGVLLHEDQSLANIRHQLGCPGIVGSDRRRNKCLNHLCVCSSFECILQRLVWSYRISREELWMVQPDREVLESCATDQ
jgi:hypothetical protein